jgi:hypothetical protein
MPRPPVGMLVVRAWVEAGSTEPLRATIRLTADTRLGFTRELSLSDASAVTEVVRQWLDEVLGQARPDKARP